MEESSSQGKRIELPAAHPLRTELYEEVHARPFPLVRAPVRVSHLAILSEPGDSESHLAHLADLAKRYSVNPPAPEASCYYATFPGFDLRWERHTEFCTYTVLRPGASETPFTEPGLGLLPSDWLAGMPGRSLVATHLEVLQKEVPDPFDPALERAFEGHLVVGSRIVDDRAALWSTLRLHSDGFSRYLLHNSKLNEFQVGRTIQRVLEIETYRIMALLGYPVAKRIWPRVRRIDTELATLIDGLARVETPEDEKRLLHELVALSQSIEHMRSDTNFRFSATDAYMTLVHRRLSDLREHKFPGRSSVTKFLDRRLTPAAATCESAERHLRDLSLRVARATESLRARIETTLEEQNQTLLESMNQRASQQLRLQEMVEGLSVAAISYYFIGLLGYALKALHDAGWDFDVAVATGAAVIPVVAGVWGFVSWRRRRIQARAGR
ncbi:MAG: DUF3422 domain-containing protein [Gammaproteobacteria bacterium]